VNSSSVPISTVHLFLSLSSNRTIFDALDHIADIAVDLDEVRWCWENTGPYVGRAFLPSGYTPSTDSCESGDK